jgi:hypothetical protein
LAEKITMDAFLRNAEEILDTACESQDYVTSEYLISITFRGSIQILSESAGWSLAALAAEHGASAVYRVRREPNKVCVEGWSAGRSCVLKRDLPKSHSSAAVRPYFTGPLVAISV